MDQMQPIASDLLKGAKRIAEFTGFNEREVRDYGKTGTLPLFKVGKHLCARKSELELRLRGTDGQR